jgi:hypothetical protein
VRESEPRYDDERIVESELLAKESVELRVSGGRQALVVAAIKLNVRVLDPELRFDQLLVLPQDSSRLAPDLANCLRH